MTFSIDPLRRFTIEDAGFIIKNNCRLELSNAAIKNIEDCRSYLDKKLEGKEEAVYGINTGFGSLCNVKIPQRDIEKLQENLVMSHACGMGDAVPPEIVKLMLLLKIQALCYGKSGVQLSTVIQLTEFFNRDILPVVYQLGSLGASGDLAPLAHLSLPLIGLGEVIYKGKKVASAEALKAEGLYPVKLASKEGLALLNGTQFMSAYGVFCLLKTEALNTNADFISAISLDAFDGRIDPFKENIQNIRPHPGQIQTAKNIRGFLSGSQLIAKEKTRVQDPYSFRCVPQVHGATKDTTTHVRTVFETEINSVTDNPTIFPESDEVISGGNFHGQPLALALDFLCIAVAELGNISERRIFQLISGLSNLPPFLSPKPGLNSGYMIPQYTAASIVSQNKQLCTPASADSIVSSNGQEDHVSMGANAATKCLRVVENTERILAIELMNAAQALEFRRPLKSSPKIEEAVAQFRKKVPALGDDRVLYKDLESALEFYKALSV